MSSSEVGNLRFGGGAPIDNAILDPLQGFDADVWVIDQQSGQYNLVGRFTSIQLTVRNATEPYLEFNQRIPRYLDGEIQIGWVLERGLLDTRVLEQTFGYSQITRELRINRGSRFQITFEMEAQELHDVGGKYEGAGTSNAIGNGELMIKTAAAPRGGNSDSRDRNRSYMKRYATGQYILTFCKVDSLTIGAQAGRSVIANRWEGLSEGIQFVDRNNVWAGQTLGAQETAYKSLTQAMSQVANVSNISRSLSISGPGTTGNTSSAPGPGSASGSA